ncbi:MAG: hypothetical protein FWC73_10735 [Defluviitaleaceae bacterium]|nr:hypothetical protein [Defluviitaleaceae bacterium]
MRKYKIFIDDTILNHLDAPNKPDVMADTQSLWGMFQTDIYDIILPETVVRIYKDILSQIQYSSVSVSGEVSELARYIKDLVLLDCSDLVIQNLAAAQVSDCDFFVSWNYKDVVNIKTIRGVKIIAMLEDLKDIVICTPTMLIQ